MRRGKPTRTPGGKASKIQLRLQASEKALIARAARLRQTTVSNFLREHAYQAAQQVLADQVHFALAPDRWRAFCQALDAPPRNIPALKRLLTTQGVCDGQGPAAVR